MRLSLLSLYTILAKSKNPFKILADAEPRRRRGKAIIVKNEERLKQRRLLYKIRTYFQENPDAEF